MNKTILMGRLTKDPEVKYLQNENSTAMARYTLAVDRRYRRMERQKSDFISCCYLWEELLSLQKNI